MGLRLFPNGDALLAVALMGSAASCSAATPEPGPVNRAVLAEIVSAPPADATWFRDCRVFDGETVREHTDVLIVGEVVVALGGDVSEHGRGELVDCDDRTLLPALIDAHVHTADQRDHLERALVFGVGTEIDMLGPPAFLAKQREEAAGANGRSRADIVGAGWPATGKGAYGTDFGIVIPTLGWPDEVSEFWDGHVASGADFLVVVFGRNMPSLWPDVVKRLVGRAHDEGSLVVGYPHSCDQVVAALATGVDGVARGCGRASGALDDLPPAGSRPRFVIPTLSRFAAEWGDKPGQSSPRDVIRRFVERGYRVLAGSDAGSDGVVHGASLHEELGWLVEAGLDPLDVLRAATSGAADIFRLEHAGRIRLGAPADLLLVRGKPDRDIRATRAIDGVWKRGRPVRRSPPSGSPPLRRR